MTRFGLPEGYVARRDVGYFDAPYLPSEIVHQPEVHDAASHFLAATGRGTLIDIGCGNGRKLLSVPARRRIGLDLDSHIAFCLAHHAGAAEWRRIDLSDAGCLAEAALADDDAVVVCADLVHKLSDPTRLLSLLAACHARGAIVLTSTPDRIRLRGPEHLGPPPNPLHVREWSLAEYRALLIAQGLPSVFAGHTIDNRLDRQPKTIVTVHDRALAEIVADVAAGGAQIPRPLAILAAYNEADVISEAVQDLLAQGCDVAAIDNWSTDATPAILHGLASVHPGRITIERFPGAGPAQYYEWRAILARKQAIAADHPGRWIIHTDADEIRRAPFPGLSLAEGLEVARRAGATRVDFTVLNFRPTVAIPARVGTLEERFRYFEFGSRWGHFVQKKAWLQGSSAVDLVSSGGHEAAFAGARDFAWKFQLRHYPLRSQAHGRRKVLQERYGRWSPEELKMGWHSQYNGFDAQSDFVWDPARLHAFDADFWSDHGLAIVTDIPRRRAGA
jgi:SAM-dependent methyltransferase